MSSTLTHNNLITLGTTQGKLKRREKTD